MPNERCDTSLAPGIEVTLEIRNGFPSFGLSRVMAPASHRGASGSFGSAYGPVRGSIHDTNNVRLGLERGLATGRRARKEGATSGRG